MYPFTLVFDLAENETRTPEVGDVVSLASGGPLMTVIADDGSGTETKLAWFDDDGVLQKNVLPSAALILEEEGEEEYAAEY